MSAEDAYSITSHSIILLFYPYLRERNGHCVDGGDYGGVHEVDGVGVEEQGRAPHSHAHDDRPEDVLEPCRVIQLAEYDESQY